MSVLKKGKRKIVVNNRIFYWYVGEGDDYYGMAHLNIVSDDKRFIVSYMIDHIKEPFIIVKGKEFKNFENLGGCWQRFSTPVWDYNVITPKVVAMIIDWCFNDESTHRVNYKGEKI